MARQVTNSDGSISLLDRYAQFEAGDVGGVRTVHHIIESEFDPDGTNGEWVLCGDQCGPRWTSADGGLTFAAPAIPPAPTTRELPKVQYLKRFTQAERIAIRAAGASNPVVNDYIELMNAVTDVVHLDDPDTSAGVQALEAVGLLVVGRAAEILA